MVVLTIFIDGKMSTVKSHKISDKVEKDIISKVLNVERVIVHVEPFFKKSKN